MNIQRIAILLAAAAALYAQTATPATPAISITAPSAAAGDGKNPTQINLALSLTGSAGNNLTYLTWQLILPQGVTIQTNGATASPAIQAAGKNAICGVDTGGCPPQWNGAGTCGVDACSLIGTMNGALSNNAITQDGPIATIPVNIDPSVGAGTLSFGLVNTQGVDTSDNLVTVGPGFPPSPPVNVTYTTQTITASCDVNGDGAVNYADVLAVAEAVINPTSQKCPLASNACSTRNVVAVLLAAMGNPCVLH